MYHFNDVSVGVRTGSPSNVNQWQSDVVLRFKKVIRVSSYIEKLGISARSVNVPGKLPVLFFFWVTLQQYKHLIGVRVCDGCLTFARGHSICNIRGYFRLKYSNDSNCLPVNYISSEALHVLCVCRSLYSKVFETVPDK